MQTAVERAGLRARCSIIVQAAAGGVGVKAVEYTQWLGAMFACTAGRPHRHAQLQQAGGAAMCTSLASAAFSAGIMRLLAATRSHAVLNSLSLDLLAASFAALGEGGAFEEIGKRGVWSSARHAASAHFLKSEKTTCGARCAWP